MFVCTYILYAFLSGWTDFDDIFRVCLSGTLDDLDSQLDPVGPIWGGARTGILKFLFINGCYWL